MLRLIFQSFLAIFITNFFSFPFSFLLHLVCLSSLASFHSFFSFSPISYFRPSQHLQLRPHRYYLCFFDLHIFLFSLSFPSAFTFIYPDLNCLRHPSFHIHNVSFHRHIFPFFSILLSLPVSLGSIQNYQICLFSNPPYAASKMERETHI